MTTMNSSDETSEYPKILSKILELVQHNDDALSSEACLVLGSFFERECMSGGDAWLTDIESYLTFEENLAIATGSLSIKELRVSAKERDDFAYAVFHRIEQRVPNSWRHASILKKAASVPGLEDYAAVFLRDHWGDDEAVTYRLLQLIWSIEPSSNFNATLTDIAENAIWQHLKDSAVETLRTNRKLDDERS
jgi:hypothetical protein